MLHAGKKDYKKDKNSFYLYRKRVDLNHQVLNTIFSKYLALPIATFPYFVLNNVYYNNDFHCENKIYVIKVKFIKLTLIYFIIFLFLYIYF